MDAFRAGEIRRSAGEVLRSLWHRRHQIWESPPDTDGVVRQAPEMIVAKILGLELDTPEEIGVEQDAGARVVTAGLLDRANRRIVIAQKFPLEWRRFTLGHEIGHWHLHPDLLLHRDRPMMVAQHNSLRRPQVEQEADLFSAELLMPSKHLRSVFQSCFGGPIDGRQADDNLAFAFSVSAGRQISAVALTEFDPVKRALLVAQMSHFFGQTFLSLCSRFVVSPTAMAIQLVDLKLVL